MLAVFMLPVGAIVYLIAFAVLWETTTGLRPDEPLLVWSGVIAGIFVAAYWLLLWFRSIRWTRERVLLTVGASVFAIGSGSFGAWLVGLMEADVGAFVSGPIAIFSWLILTVFIWRDTRRERARRIDIRAGGALVCPVCGYNMTGLRQTICPECGATYTIDELVASQPGEEAAEIEEPSAAR